MPTPPPSPVRPPENEIEREDREEALRFLLKILEGFHNYAYSTRSYMPAGLDCTGFFAAIGAVSSFAEERPDWTLEIIRRAKAEKPTASDNQAEWLKYLTNEEVALVTGPSVELCRTIGALRMKLQPNKYDRRLRKSDNHIRDVYFLPELQSALHPYIFVRLRPCQ